MKEKTMSEKDFFLDDIIYHKMVDSIEDYAIFLLDPDGNIKSWNIGAERIKGYKQEEVLGKNFSMFFSPEEIQHEIPEKIRAEAKEKGKTIFERWGKKKDGTTIWLNNVLTALQDPETNKLIGFTKIVRDFTERKKAEDNSEFLASILRNIHDPIISIGLDRVISDWNEAAEHTFGWRKEEAIGNTIRELLKPELPPDGVDEVSKGLQEKGFWKGEIVFQSKKDETVYTLLTASFIKGADGKVSGIVMMIRDITERKKTEQELEKLNNNLELKVKQRTQEIFEREKQFKSLVENDYTITSLIGENYEVIYRSPSAEAILGWTEDERSNMTIEDITHPDDLASLKSVMKEVMANPGKPISTTFRNLHKDGHYVWIESTAVNRIPDPNVRAVVLNMHDITERKNSEDAIKKNEENYRLLIERISDGFIALDNDFKYTYANKKVGEITGKDPEYLIGKCVWDVFPDAVGSKTYEAFHTALKEQRYIYNVDYYEGLNLWQENHIYPSADGLSIFIRDISERKRAELLIKQLNENLEERVKQRTTELVTANKALESFSYMVSHDLQSPLRTLNGFTNIIIEKYSASFDSELKGLFDYILTSCKRMNAIIDDLLKLAKFGNNKLTLGSVKMQDLFRRVWNNLIHNSPTSAQLELLPLPDINADESMMEQVVVNLLSNAIKYSSKEIHPKITVGTCLIDGKTTFFVRDNGVGFSMEHYSKLFGAFQRLHATSEFEGTGIGLLLVKRIIENHGGQVWAEGKENEGATFYFSIP
ncbi:MAG TPA: PAS domain S-box protein [Bacteroidia bacterium]|jgi:PAS domain S-box-containing protein|nr:PAS domain S-box protein [Bacteroidia bacterium]